MIRNNRIPVLLFSVPLILLLGTASLIGLLHPQIYSRETPDWLAQSVGQDAVDLFLVLPVLSLASLYTYRKERLAVPLWGGSLLYLIYTFTIYCFNVHFNQLFIVYWLTLGFSFYGFVYFMYNQQGHAVIKGLTSRLAIRVTGIYLLVIASLFYLLWMSEILPALRGGYIPKSLVEAGLFTNPVQVIDLSVFLPAIFIVGVLLLREHPLGFTLAPVLLTFFVLMDFTIAVIMVVQSSKGLEDISMLITSMAALTLISIGLLLWYLKESVQTTN